MARLALLLLLPALTLASLCCQGLLKEIQTNDTCPHTIHGVQSDPPVQCPDLCCTSRSTGGLPGVVAHCMANASAWIQVIREANTGAISYAEECLVFNKTVGMVFNQTNSTVDMGLDTSGAARTTYHLALILALLLFV